MSNRSYAKTLSSYLSAPLTHMRLLAGVNPGVDSQGRALNELFATTRVVANMRSYTTVYSLYLNRKHKSRTLECDS